MKIKRPKPLDSSVDESNDEVFGLLLDFFVALWLLWFGWLVWPL
jgi:hypothetical protein